MVVQKLINQIQELGYRFELVGDNIKFIYTKGGQTPKEAIPILMQVKECKREVIEYLQQQPLKGQDAIDRVLTMFGGRIVGVRPPEEPQKPVTMQCEPTERDFELDRQINEPCPNPKGFKCFICGDLGQRYGLAQDNTKRWWFGWVCLKCKPERN
jgi:hypothetical protein